MKPRRWPEAIRRVLQVFALAAACAATSFAQDADQTRALGDFARVELRELAAEVKVHPKVMDKLATEIGLRLTPTIARWNEEGGKPDHAGTLAVEVTVIDMKFVSGGKRFWAGGMAGGSHAGVLVRIVDVESGAVLRSQEFREQAGGTAGAWSMGATDNAMLDRLAASVSSWVIAQRGDVPAAAATAN